MTGSTAASAAPGPSDAPSTRTTPAIAPPPAATEDAPPPTPPDAVPTTVEELPAGFWDEDGGPTAALLATDVPPAPRPAEASAPARATPPPAASAPTPDPAPGPPALASLQGLALLQAVFPGRVTKVERAATASEDDAVPDEAAVTAPIDAPDDDPEPGADAPLPRTP